MILWLMYGKVWPDYVRGLSVCPKGNVRIWGAAWNGTVRKKAGIVHAMAPDLRMKENEKIIRHKQISESDYLYIMSEME